MPEFDLSASLFFVGGKRERCSGSAFLVQGRKGAMYLATALHVVKMAVRKLGAAENGIQGATIPVVFYSPLSHFTDPDPVTCQAKVTQYISDVNDVAFLSIVDGIPSAATPVVLAPAQEREGDAFFTMGARDAAANGGGVIRGLGSGPLPLLPGRRPILELEATIDTGLSGAPVQLASGAVVGMITSKWIPGVEDAIGRITPELIAKVSAAPVGYAVTSETLALVCDYLDVPWSPSLPLSSEPIKIHLKEGVALELLPVEAGRFPMGNDTKTRKKQNPSVQSLMRKDWIDLKQPFFIGKVTVTNEQFAVFVDAMQQRFAGNSRMRRPPNHPVVDVSWFDAMSFCKWLDALSREYKAEYWPEGYQIRLATEAEWEKAARGPDGRDFPWGDEWDPCKCNSLLHPQHYHTTTAVDLFVPDGLSWYGCHDMAGNVWEWTLSMFMDYPYQDDERNTFDTSSRRVLRGGASSTSQEEELKTYYRGRALPKDRYPDIGFRVVFGPRLINYQWIDVPFALQAEDN